MLRRLLPLLVAVVGVVIAGLGVASATLWRADDVLVATLTADSPYVVTAPGVLDMGGTPVTVRARTAGSAPVVLVVGRDSDVLGWVGRDRYQLVTGLSGWHELTGRVATASPTASPSGSAAAGPTAAPSPSASGSAAAKLADPAGSDMWVVQATGKGSASLTWPRQAGRWSLLVASPSGTAPTLELAWPRSVTTPYLVPCLVIGGLLALFGLGWLFRRWRSAHQPEQWTSVDTSAVPVVAQDPPRTRRELRAAAQRAAHEGARPAAALPDAAGEGREPAPVPSSLRATRTGATRTGAKAPLPADGSAVAGAGGSSRPSDVAATPVAAVRPDSADAPAVRAGADAPGAGLAGGAPNGAGGSSTPVRRAAAAPRPGAPAAASDPRSGSAASFSGRTPAPAVPPSVDRAAAWPPGAAAADPTRAADPAPGAPGSSHPLPSWARRAEPGAHVPVGPAEDGPGATRPVWVPGRSSTPRPVPPPGVPPVPVAEGASRPADGPGAGGRARPAWLRPGRTAPAPTEAAVEPAEPPAAPPAVPDRPEPVRNRADEWRRTWGIPVSHEDGTSAAPPTTGEEDR